MLSGSTWWPLYFFDAHATCLLLSPLPYASMKQQVRVENLQVLVWTTLARYQKINAPVHAIERYWFESRKNVAFEVSLFWWSGIVTINLFRISPTLLDEIKFAMKFRKEKHWNSSCFACSRQIRLDSNEVRLVVQHPAAAIVCCSLRTLEVLALCKVASIP